MSHDIDLIVTRPQLASIETIVEDMSESYHFVGRKWRATLEGIHLDLYVPYESRLGRRLQLRVETLIQRQEIVDDWVVLDLPAHIATKFAALLDRPDTRPGEKDRIEIMALLDQEIDIIGVLQVIHEASSRSSQEVTNLVGEAVSYLGDHRLGRDQRKRLAKLAAQLRDSASSRDLLESSPAESNYYERGGRWRGPSLAP